MKEPTVVVIKSSSWRTAYQSKNHPEYIAIFDLIHYYESKINFVLVGTSKASTRGVQLKNRTIAWDIQVGGRFRNITYYLDLMKLLFKYRPNLVITLGLLNILPVAFYSLLSWRSKYVPVFIGEFGYYGEKRTGQLLTILGFKTMGTLLQLSQKKLLTLSLFQTSQKNLLNT